jgi:hypothetical protein
MKISVVFCLGKFSDWTSEHSKLLEWLVSAFKKIIHASEMAKLYLKGGGRNVYYHTFVPKRYWGWRQTLWWWRRQMPRSTLLASSGASTV